MQLDLTRYRQPLNQFARTFKPELCSLNMGSMNFGLFPVLDRITEPLYRPFNNNDINWCLAAKSNIYNCTVAIIRGVTV